MILNLYGCGFCAGVCAWLVWAAPGMVGVTHTQANALLHNFCTQQPKIWSLPCVDRSKGIITRTFKVLEEAFTEFSVSSRSDMVAGGITSKSKGYTRTGAEIQIDRIWYLSQNGYGLLHDLLQLHIIVPESKAMAARSATRFSCCFAIQRKHAAKRKVAAAEHSVCEDP